MEEEKQATQEEIEKIQEQLARTPSDPNFTFVCNSFTYCTECEDWWPCECPESKPSFRRENDV